MSRYIRVSATLLLDPGLSAAAKVLWAVKLSSGDKGPEGLASLAGVSWKTARRRLAGAHPAGAPAPAPGGHPAGVRVSLPAVMLSDPHLGAQAKVLYGLLQVTPGFRWPVGCFTYVALRTMTGHGIATLKRAVANLTTAGWLEAGQKSPRGPVTFTLVNPEVAQRKNALAMAKWRIKRAEYKGEAIMREYLTLLVDSADYNDNATPAWLVNPFTDERLQLDRFYESAGVAWEFNGPQHYDKTPRFAKSSLARQRARDHMKAGQCADRGIRLIVVHAEDLTLEGMSAKVGNLLPRRDLTGCDALIQHLKERSEQHREEARKGRFTREHDQS